MFSLLLGFFSISCISPKEEEFEYVYTHSYYSTQCGDGKFLVSKSSFSYMGSDEQFDYYKEDGAFLTPEKHYKCKTLGERFYPHSYPFEGWNGKEYYFRAYQGRIIVTPCDEWSKLKQYYQSEVTPILKQYEQECRNKMSDKQWYDEHTSMDVQEKIFKLCLTLLNQWSIQHWGQDRLNISPMPFANPISSSDALPNYKNEWYVMNYREEINLRLAMPDGSSRPITNYYMWEEDARFGR